MTGVLVAVVLAGTAGLAVLKLTAWFGSQRQLVCLQVRFARNLEAEAVTAFLSGLSGWLLPWWRRWLVVPLVAVEVHATASGIEHYVIVPAAWSAALENLLQASLPAGRYEPVEPPTVACHRAVEYRLTTGRRPLRRDLASVATKLLTSLQPLGKGEAVVVQWLLTAAGPVPPVRVAGAKQTPTWLPMPGTVPDAETATALRQKQAEPLLLGVARIGVQAANPGRAVSLLRQVETAWYETRAPGVHLRRRWLPPALVAHCLRTRRPPLVAWPGLYNTEELAGLIGWPIAVTGIPGLVLGGCRQLAASPLIPATGTVIADSNFPGNERPLALDLQARLRHVHILGPTGTGKSVLIVNMVVQDLEAGYGVVVIDPKGDLVDAVLARVPEHRQDDVIVLDPADDSRPVGLNPLRAGSGSHAEVVVENLVGLFKSLYRSSWGPRTDDVLRAALMTLSGAGAASLCEVPLLLTDPNYRRRLVGALDDPVGLESFWGWYEGLSDGERLAVVGPPLNKVRAFTMRPRVRAIVGQTTPALDFGEVMAQGKVLLVSLASGLLGEEAASLLGALVVAELWHTTTARAGLPPEQRPPVMAFLDEWQHFVHLPTPMAAVLAEARGLGLGMTLAHQNLSQLPDADKNAVLSNARSRVVFQLPAADARLIARDLGGLLSPDDLQGLGAYEVAGQLFAAGATQPPATGRTRPLPPITADAAELRERSRQRYGVDRAEVEADIRRRQSGGRTDAPVGRRRAGGQP